MTTKRRWKQVSLEMLSSMQNKLIDRAKAQGLDILVRDTETDSIEETIKTSFAIIDFSITVDEFPELSANQHLGQVIFRTKCYWLKESKSSKHAADLIAFAEITKFLVGREALMN